MESSTEASRTGMSFFFFFQGCFYLYNDILDCCRLFNSLPNDKFADQSNLKALAHNKIDVMEKTIICVGKDSPSIRLSVGASIKSSFKKLLLRNY